MISFKVTMAMTLILLGSIASLMYVNAVEGGRINAQFKAQEATASGPKVFDVTKYGTINDGKDDSDDYGLESQNSAAFIQAWRAACDSPGEAKVLVPKGKFMIGRALFAGPCNSPRITFEVQGTLLANPDASYYNEPEWFIFERVNGLTLTGSGEFDASGAKRTSPPTCRSDDPACVPGPTTIKFRNVTFGLIEGITSKNPMGFHIFLTYSKNIMLRHLQITSPREVLNSDGIHIEQSEHIMVADSKINTGEDCVSIGNGALNVSVSRVVCGLGYGFSVGNLAKYLLQIHTVVFDNCKLEGTEYGTRIKHWPEFKGSEMSDITFMNIEMNHVKNPIVIDYVPADNPAPGSKTPTGKIFNVHFKNFTGTSATKQLVNIACSPLMPCDNIEVADINLTFDPKNAAPVDPKKPNPNAEAVCSNAKVVFQGQNKGLKC